MTKQSVSPILRTYSNEKHLKTPPMGEISDDKIVLACRNYDSLIRNSVFPLQDTVRLAVRLVSAAKGVENHPVLC